MLLAFSDLHVAYPEHKKIVEALRPRSAADWLLVAGDVGERVSDIEWALQILSRQGLAKAYASGVVCSDEWLLHPDPYPSREAWCRARVELTERRLATRDPALPVVLMNHFPLTREPGGLRQVLPAPGTGL